MQYLSLGVLMHVFGVRYVASVLLIVPKGKLQLGVCGMNHPLAMSLLWLGIFQILSHTTTAALELVLLTIQCFFHFRKTKLFWTTPPPPKSPHNELQTCGLNLQGIYWRIQRGLGPLVPEIIFKIMQFSGNF